jgi:hypothetical protein
MIAGAMSPAPRRTRGFRFAERQPLGPGGPGVSPFCVGMVDEPEAVIAAYEAGINFFFVSGDLHWPMYQATRVGLERLLARPGVRAELVVGVVAYVTQPEFMPAALAEGIAAVAGLHRADLLIAGGCYGHDLMARLDVLHAFRRASTSSTAALGASFHDRDAARLAVDRALLDIAFVRYNAAHPGALVDLFPHLPRPRDTLVYNFTTTRGHVPEAAFPGLGLGDDYWRPGVTDHYRLAAARPELDGLLCSPRTPAMLDRLGQAMEQPPLDAEEEQFLLDLAALASGRFEIDPAG